jgi:phospholipase A1
MGNFEFQSVYKISRQTLGLLFRNNVDFDENRGALQLDWSFPLHQRLRGYVQWFNGYGESLIDHDENVNSIGVGLQLTDWL